MTMRDVTTFIVRHERRILWVIGLAVTATLSAICLLKYHLFLYDGIDLAYFTQVFWQFLHGQAWTQSIHPHASLGDHAELAIPLLLPFFALWPDPRMLLLLQIAVLVAPAFVVYAIARRVASGEHSLVPFVCTLLYLLNPLMHNIAVFEFHMLAFAVLPLMLAVYAYVGGNKRLFLGAVAAALLVREDVALVVAGFGLLGFVERRAWFWRVTPIVIGVTWFFAAMRLVGAFAPAGGYKFLVYYAWLGDSFGGIIAGALRHPLVVMRHFLRIGNLEMVLAFLMSVAFLPLLAATPLLLLVGPLAQILLGAPGGSGVVTSTHYATLFLPGLVLASVYGARRVLTGSWNLQLPLAPSHGALAGLVVLIAVYASVFLGPIPGAVGLFSRDEAWMEARQFRAAIQEVPREASVVASYRLLPHLALREHLYSLHYVFLGVTQFAEGTYVPPMSADVFVIDPYDAVRYRAQFLRTAWAKPHYEGGFDRVNDATAGLCADDFAAAILLRRCEFGGSSLAAGSYQFALPAGAPEGTGTFILGPTGTTQVSQ